MMRNTLAAVLLTLSIAFVGGCSSEECEGDDCTVFDPGGEATANPSDGVDCAGSCALFAGCDVIDDIDCELACEQGAFTASEMACFQTVGCADALATCFDVDDDTGEPGRHPGRI